MAKSPEGKVKEDVIEILKRYAPYVAYDMKVPYGYGVNGVADFVLCAWGRYVAIETKATSKKPLTGPQKLYRARVIAAGAYHMVIHKDNVDVVRVQLEWMKQYAFEI